MATGYVILDIGAAVLPDNTTNNAPAAVVMAKSSASAPGPFWMQGLFGATAKEWLHWSFQMPGDYASAPVLRFSYKMASATSGDVIVNGSLAAVTDGDSTDVDAKAYATTNASSGITVPGTAGYIDQQTITLTNDDSVAANDFVLVGFARDGADGGDTASGDLELIAVTLEYTTI